jgi:acyl-coenzyme A synthetase/AMP-(fatty) acid ligase
LLCPAIGLLTTAGFRFPIAAWRAGGAMLGWEERDVVPTTSPQIVESCSLLVASPVNLQSLLNRLPEPWQGRDSRTTIVVGARLAGQLRDRALQRACARIDIAYGSTEAGRIAIGDAALVDRHPGAVGFVSDGATVEIVDAQDRSLPPGQEGIVRLRAPAMCNGYERSRATRMRSPFRNGWFYPGDEGIMFDDGLLAITGREGETVNVGGHKLSLPTLENRLSAVRGVADVCVVPVALSQGDIVAIVAVLGGHSNLTPLRNIARGLLPRRCPFRIVAVPRIPRNQAGKLDRGKLSRQLAAQL